MQEEDSFIEQLRCSTPSKAVTAIEAIVATGTQAAIPTLIAALSHHHPSVWAAATSGLVQLAPVSVEPLSTLR